MAPPVRRIGGAVKPRRFDYARPDSVAEALALLAEHGDAARVLAGGQSLMAMLNLRLLEPAILVDIARLEELDTIKITGDKVEVGAAVIQNRLKDWPELAARLPLLARALPFVGHFQTRNRGTVCGSVAHADPSSEIPLVLATLGGEVVLRSRRGLRTVAAADFQRGMLTTAREPDELITAVRFPVQTGKRVAFREVARRHGDFALIAIAASVETAVESARGADVVRVGIGGVADRPAVRRIVIDGAGAAKSAFEALAWELEGYDDIHASARLRRDLLRQVGPAVVEEALQCAA
jgi:2-furoyl-CoA dehydrogenase FAD binding subunit